MSATPEGNRKAIKATLSRNPDHFREIGAIGGRNGNTGGFYKDKKRAQRSGRIGGTIGKINHKYIETKDGYHYYTKLSTGDTVKYEVK